MLAAAALLLLLAALAAVSARRPPAPPTRAAEQVKTAFVSAAPVSRPHGNTPPGRVHVSVVVRNVGAPVLVTSASVQSEGFRDVGFTGPAALGRTQQGRFALAGTFDCSVSPQHAALVVLIEVAAPGGPTATVRHRLTAKEGLSPDLAEACPTPDGAGAAPQSAGLTATVLRTSDDRHVDLELYVGAGPQDMQLLSLQAPGLLVATDLALPLRVVGGATTVLAAHLFVADCGVLRAGHPRLAVLLTGTAFGSAVARRRVTVDSEYDDALTPLLRTRCGTR